jgi:hypothetical protein
MTPQLLSKCRGFVPAFLLILLAACATDPPGIEHGPDNTIAYKVPVEASEPGTKIEVNYKPAGVAPMTVTIYGDRDGTFHNFGSDEYIIRAYPPNSDQFPQTKIFKTGAMGVKDDRIPQRIFFDLGSNKPKL